MFNSTGYVAKNIKNLVGREGHGYTATIYRRGAKFATVADYADGGPIRTDLEDTSEKLPNDWHVMCDRMVNAAMDSARLTRLLKLKVVTAAGREIHSYTLAGGAKPPAANHPFWDGFKDRHAGETILNLLPFDKALAKFSAGV